MRDDDAKQNTDRELWREREGDYYADSVFVTERNGIGLNGAGHVVVMPVRSWLRLATDLANTMADLTLATRLLRRAVTELNHHVSYEDEETMKFLEREKEG